MSKKPLNNNDEISDSTCKVSIFPNMIHVSLTHNDETKDTTNSCSTNNDSPDEEIIT